VVDEKIKKASAVEDSPEERSGRMVLGWKQSVFGRLGALPRGLLYFGGGIVLILILALVFWGGNRLFGSLRGTESPTPIVTTAVAVPPTKTNTSRPAATDTIRPATATMPGDTQELSITDTPTRRPTHTSSPTNTATLPPTITPSPTPMIITDDFGVPMALVPAGLFEMGSQAGDDNEKPVHIITLGDFYIDQYEVTNARYAQCVDANVCGRPKYTRSETRNQYYGNSAYTDYPVIFVNWEDARTYCEWRDARLPTEAEWEKAARGGLEGELYPWGNGSPDCSLANFNNVRLCVGDTSAVGSYGPNSYQLFDMAGNVWEWVQSLYEDYPYDPADGRENVNLAGLHVLRGGAWGSGGSYLRVAYRYVNDLSSTTNSIGFRCARTP
jgi:formylglycine-generating enzyme required for sulfatase activity